MRVNRIAVFLLAVIFLLAWIGSGAARQPYPVGDSGAGKPGKTAISTKGTIKQAGERFFLSSPEFKNQLLILNPDTKLLGELSTAGRSVNVQGFLSAGGDGVLIQKIDETPYTAVKMMPYPVGKGGPYPVGKEIKK